MSSTKTINFSWNDLNETQRERLRNYRDDHTGLPLKNQNEVTYGSPEIHYNVGPGTMMFFPSYMPHMYSVDIGYEPFRFIHWNVQAIPTPSKIGI